MSLRKQRSGNQKPWTVQQLKAGLLEFYKKHGRYPTATEVDAYEYLPSARTIERSHGGLVELRKRLGLGKEYDYRAGSHSSKRAHTINERAHKVEQRVYSFLCQRFGQELVHREYFVADDKRTRVDFFVYDNSSNFCVDVFYPKDMRNLIGCLNSKLIKYQRMRELLQNTPVIFLQMNEEIQQDALNTLLKRKKNPVQGNQQLMAWEKFQSICKTRKRR